MRPVTADEWKVLEGLLPARWKAAARELKAFRRARYLPDPAPLLRLLLFHAVNDGGLRETVAQARTSGIADMSQVALLKRLRTAGPWLTWLGAELCRALRDELHLPHGLRARVVDSTTVQGPASKGTEWRVHYCLDLMSLSCDWYELTDDRGAELLERTPMQAGDVMLGDRNYFRRAGVRAAAQAGAHVLTRLRWRHTAMHDSTGRDFRALEHAKRLKVGQVKEWPVVLPDPETHEPPIPGRVVALKLPAAIAEKARRGILRAAAKKQRRPDPRSLLAAQFVMIFTTVPVELLSARDVLELYRHRWQIELAFKRLKQLLKLGHLPHKDPRAARGWILAKLVVALLLDTLFRNACAISPWGFRFSPPPTTTAFAA